MRALFEKMRGGHGCPCLFYPAAREKGVPIETLLRDAKAQSGVLRYIAEEKPYPAVIRMTELWCEGRAFGMDCDVRDGAFPRLGAPLFCDAEEMEDISVPDAVNAVTEPLIEAVGMASRATDKPLIAGITGPYTLGCVLNGSEDFMMNCVTDPETTLAFLERATDFLIAYATEYKKAGAAALMVAEPAVAMISPAMTETFSCDLLRRFLDAVQDEAFPVIYHNCGRVTPHLPVLAHLPAAAFHFGSDVDMGAALDAAGAQRCVMGNADPALFLPGNEAAARARALSLKETYGDRPNFILSTGCDLAPGARVGDWF